MTISASNFVKINPGVLAAGGNELSLNALFLTENTAMPTGQILSFATALAVGNFFGMGSTEYAMAQIYFNGFANSTVKPSAMLFACYNAANRAAFLQGGSLAGLTLTQLQAFSGTVIINVNGTVQTSASINLSAATSFSNAASLILAGFTDPTFTVTWNAVQSCFTFTSSTSGTGSTIAAATGTLSPSLNLTAGTVGIISQGAAADTPNSAMVNATNLSQNYVTVVTLFEPDLSDKTNFAVWFNASDDAYAWLAWDSDAQASVQNATEPFGVLALAAGYNGVACIGGDPAAVPAGSSLATLAMSVAVFVAGAIASLNTAATNGRKAMAYLSQAGLVPTCANNQTAANLIANGYSYYGAVATRAQNFDFFWNGNMPGNFDWIDTYINQIWINSEFQLALMELETTVGSIPYDEGGYSLMRAALQDPIQAALTFGAIRTGVELSALQIAEVNQAAGLDISSILQTEGYYLQILDPGSIVRQERGSPIVNFWYTDGGSVQQITMSSTDIL